MNALGRIHLPPMGLSQRDLNACVLACVCVCVCVPACVLGSQGTGAGATHVGRDMQRSHAPAINPSEQSQRYEYRCFVGLSVWTILVAVVWRNPVCGACLDMCTFWTVCGFYGGVKRLNSGALLMHPPPRAESGVTNRGSSRCPLRFLAELALPWSYTTHDGRFLRANVGDAWSRQIPLTAGSYPRGRRGRGCGRVKVRRCGGVCLCLCASVDTRARLCLLSCVSFSVCVRGCVVWGRQPDRALPRDVCRGGRRLARTEPCLARLFAGAKPTDVLVMGGPWHRDPNPSDSAPIDTTRIPHRGGFPVSNKMR